MKAFRTATNTVRLALGSHLEDEGEESENTMFDELARKYKVDSSTVEWMKEVFAILRKCGELKANDYDPYSVEVQCMIFYWISITLGVRTYSMSPKCDLTSDAV